MEKFDPIDIEFLINNAEVKADAKKVKDDIRGIGDAAEEAKAKVGGKSGRGGIADPLHQAGNAAEVAGRKAAASRPQWNGLGNSINQLSREIPAFAYSAQTGFMALSNNIPILADEIGRLKAQNDALVASGQKGVPVWKQVVKGLISWQTALSVGVALLTIFGKDIVDWVGELFKGKEALDQVKKSQEQLNKAFEGNEFKKAAVEVSELRINLDLAKKGMADKKAVVEQYNSTIGQTAKTAKNLDDVEKGLVANANLYIEMTLKKAAANLALEEASKKAFEQAQEAQKSAEEFANAGDKVTANIAATGALGGSMYGTNTFDSKTYDKSIKEDGEKRKKARLKQVEEEKKALEDIAKDFMNDAAAAAKKMGGILLGDPDPDVPDSKVLNDRKNLLEKIAELDREYARKQLDRDEEELQALRDKFTKVRNLIEEFNRDPKNAKKKIDISGLGVIQDKAEADLTYKQDTRNLKEELEKQRELYNEIEKYKTTFGIEKTRERYGEQLREFENYAQLLRSKADENKDAFDAVANGTATGAQVDRVALLREEIQKEKRLTEEGYMEMLAGLMDYQQKRNRLVEQYTQKRLQLLADGKRREAEELKRQHQAELDDMDLKYAKSTDEYKALIRGVEGLSETAARAVIANARKMVEALFAAGKLSDEAAREILAKIDDLEATVNGQSLDKLNKIAQQVKEISYSFMELGDAVGYFDEGLGDSIATMGELGNVAADAAGSVAAFMSGNILGGITGAISAISGIFRIGAKSRESERKAKAEIVKINQRIEDGERRINELLRERNIARAKEIDLTLQGIEAQRDALALAKSQNTEDQKALLRELQNSEYIAGSRTKKYGGFLGIGRKTKVVNDYASMMGLTFEEIERLFERGQLDGRAAELFEQLRKLREEGEDINGMLADLQLKAQEIFTGTTSSAIADSIIEGLRQGHDSFEDFAGDVESMLQGAILNAIKYQVLEEPLQKLYEQFAKYAESEGELNEYEAEAIRRKYQEQIQKAIDQYEQWSKVIDQDLLSGQDTQKGLQGAIRRELTEETGSELTGLFRGQYDITKRHLQLHEKHFEVEQRNFETTRSIMQYSALIEQNTAATVVQLQYAVSELKMISKQTKSPQSARDQGK